MKLQCLQKVQIWASGFLVHQINSLWDIFILKQNFQKNKVIIGKTPLFVIGPFCNLNTGFWYGNFVWKICIFNLSTKKWYFSFLKKVFVFQKFCIKIKVFKTFKISTECHTKSCWSLKLRACLKILSTVF